MYLFAEILLVIVSTCYNCYDRFVPQEFFEKGQLPYTCIMFRITCPDSYCKTKIKYLPYNHDNGLDIQVYIFIAVIICLSA